ncbi:MAG: adenylate/guanylate cyclase domain-containing protein [Alphaproteobacteria bacterium]
MAAREDRHEAPAATSFDQPFPLRRRFRRQILPALLALLAATTLLMVIGAGWLTEQIYLEEAGRRVQIIDRALSDHAPEAWARMKRGEAPRPVYASEDGARLLSELRREAEELNLTRLKIYNADGMLVFSTETAKIGTKDISPAFLKAVTEGEASVVRRARSGESSLYELYVPLTAAGTGPLVFELYEPVDYLDDLLIEVAAAAAAVPGVILLGLTMAMMRLVGRAQRDIDRRSALVGELRARLERLVSGQAARAMRKSVGGGAIVPSRSRCTILFADVRDFTSFSESHPPEQVLKFLNGVMASVVGAVAAEGGDIDKLIGDAVLARFQGPGSEARAVAAARGALAAVEDGAPPRGIGIGIYTGDVISGTIGSADRMDFTVIGDSVNVAARLCSAAARGEIVADAETVAAAGAADFGPVLEIAVKGRRGAVRARRLPAAPAAR